MAKVIYLSPSNHGEGQNKCLKFGCYEDKHTRLIAEVASKHLVHNGFEVYIAKEETPTSKRCTESNKMKADLHVPIHTNASKAESARYLMFMFYADNDETRELFNVVSNTMETIYPENKDSVFVVRRDLVEVKKPKARTLYCELGFHTNRTDVDNFIHNHELVGKVLAQGICKYYDVEFKDYTEESTVNSDHLISVNKTGIYIYEEIPKIVSECPKGTYTIVEEKDGFGKLKSNLGYIKLSDVKKIKSK